VSSLTSVARCFSQAQSLGLSLLGPRGNLLRRPQTRLLSLQQQQRSRDFSTWRSLMRRPVWQLQGRRAISGCMAAYSLPRQGRVPRRAQASQQELGRPAPSLARGRLAISRGRAGRGPEGRGQVPEARVSRQRSALASSTNYC
jgi:hypothetical protein